MKRPPVDIEQVVTSEFLGKIAFLKKFVRYWGTEWVDGVEVLRGRNWYYNVADTDRALKVAKLLGFYNNIVNTNMKGVSSAWLYLNQSNSNITDLSGTVLSEYFGQIPTTAMKVDTLSGFRTANVIKATVHIFPHVTSTITTINSPITDQLSLKEELRDEYQYLFDNYTVSSSSPSDGYLDTVARYALLSNDIEVNITKVTISIKQQVVDAKKTFIDLWKENENNGTDTMYKTRTILVPTYTAHIDIIDPIFTSSTDIITTILEDRAIFMGSTPPDRVDNYNKYLTYLQVNKMLSVGVAPRPENLASFITYHPPTPPINPSLWVLSNNMYYLKKSTLENGGVLSLTERINLVGSTIDSDYSEKSRNWWEGVLTLIVVAVAIYYGGPQAGAKASALVVAATAITYVAFALAVYSAVMDAIGQEGAAMSASSFNRTIAPIVKVASIVLVVNSIYSMASNTAKKGAEEAVKNEGKYAVGSTAYDAAVAKLVDTQFTDMLMQGITDTAATEVKNITFEKAVDIANMASEMYQKNKLTELQEGIKSQQKKLAELEEANEASKYGDLAKAFAASYTNPLGNDLGLYAFDRAYEPVTGNLHIGNIQATTVSAMWLADDMV